MTSKKKIWLVLAQISAILLMRGAVYAQSDGLSGPFYFNATGQALIGSPTRGLCKVTGTTPAALTNGQINFLPNGTCTGAGSSVSLSVGATSCSFSNYFLSCSYTETVTNDGTVIVSGTFTTNANGNFAPCRITLLQNQPFTVTGKFNTDGAFSGAITTGGAGPGSTYAEGTRAGPTCSGAPIYNFVTDGSINN